jgi:SAM-dependent methyltransferase
MNSTQRFSNRVDDYIKYRPRYPDAVLDTLEREIGKTPAWTIADVGSGTGIVSEMFLKRGHTVYGIEPNAEMRNAAEKLLSGYPAFCSVNASAEQTTLGAKTIDLVCAAQAFHWFEAEQAKAEFSRILRPTGLAALIWNHRRIDSTPFLQAYERVLLDYGTDYAMVSERYPSGESVAAWFGPRGCVSHSFPNYQRFDWDGLCGRSMSASYVPAPTNPKHGAFIAALRACFDLHQCNGQVVFEYDTRLYFGQLST